jgi:hypothetical protein
MLRKRRSVSLDSGSPTHVPHPHKNHHYQTNCRSQRANKCGKLDRTPSIDRCQVVREEGGTKYGKMKHGGVDPRVPESVDYSPASPVGRKGHTAFWHGTNEWEREHEFESRVRSGVLPQVRAFAHSISNACRYKLAMSPRYDQRFQNISTTVTLHSGALLISILHLFVRSYTLLPNPPNSVRPSQSRIRTQPHIATHRSQNRKIETHQPRSSDSFLSTATMQPL